MLEGNTRFGNESLQRPKDHEILSHHGFSEINILKSLKDRASRQIGSSGGGNHFVEFGMATITHPGNELSLPTGNGQM